jgi:hypothetical protein
MARNWVQDADGKPRRWAGGRIAAVLGGERYVLERTIQARRYTIPLKAASLQQALAQLAAWEDDPQAYLERLQARQDKVRGLISAAVGLTDDLIAELDAAMLNGTGPWKEPTSTKHRRNTVSYARWWQKALKGHDLRKVSKSQLKAALAGKKAEKGRTISLKTVCMFLRDLGLLDGSNDPGRHLQVAQAAPAKIKKAKGYSANVLQRVYAQVDALPRSGKGGPKPEPDQAQAVRDCMRLQVCYGLHLSEVQRIANGADAVVTVLEGQGEIAGTVRYRHKSGDPHTVSLDAKALAAVQRLQARGRAPTDGCMRLYLAKACESINVSAMVPGQFRHSLVSIGQHGRMVAPMGGGLSLQDLTEITGHKSTATAKRFYDNQAVPRLLVLPLDLKHPHDPVPIAKVKQQA